MNHVEMLKKLDACEVAIEWAKTKPDWETCWAECPRGDWLLWTPGLDAKKRVLAACACSRLVLHLVPEGDISARAAIESAEAWARDGVPIAKRCTSSDTALIDAISMKGEGAWAVESARYAASSKDNPDFAPMAVHCAREAVTIWIERMKTTSKEDMDKKFADAVRRFFPEAPELPTREDIYE